MTDQPPPGLLALGRDVFVMYILPQLEARDLNALRQTCHELDALAADPAVWHAIYNSMFPPPEALPISSPGWEERCSARCGARMYTWGSSEAGRLGVSLGEVTWGHRGRRGVNRPWAVPAFSSLVARNIGCGGYFTAVLSTHGDVYVVGDFNGQLRGAGPPIRLQVAGAGEGGDLRFSTVSCGRNFVLAQDTGGQVVLWLQSREDPGCRLDFGGLAVRKVTAGWAASAAIVADLGLIVWQLPGERSPHIKVDYSVVPHTRPAAEPDADWQVADVAVGGDFVVFTTQNGRIFSTSLDFEADALPPPEYVAAIHDAAGGAGISTVAALLNRLVAVTADKRIIQAEWLDGHFTNAELLDLADVSQVAVGDHHCLALTTTGELYAWGTEPHSSGAFGLGPPADIEAAGGQARPIRWFASDSSLARPTRVPAPAMYKIAAGGWHSAAVGQRADTGGQN